MERQSGTLRTGTSGVRVRHRHHPRRRPQVRRPSPPRPGGRPAGAAAAPQDPGPGPAAAGSAPAGHRCDLGGRPHRAPQAAAHGPPDLPPAAPGAAGVPDRGVDRPRVRAGAEARARAHGQGDLRPPDLRLGQRGPGRLVRGRRRPRRRPADPPGLCPPQHGQWRRLPPSVHPRDPASLPGSARTGLRLLWRGLSPAPL